MCTTGGYKQSLSLYALPGEAKQESEQTDSISEQKPLIKEGPKISQNFFCFGGTIAFFKTEIESSTYYVMVISDKVLMLDSELKVRVSSDY